jgi:hypothetical protein
MPTFAVEEMTLLELEYAATGPDRLLNILKAPSHDTEPLTPITHRRLANINLNWSEFCDVYIVPGGRYLVAVTTTNLSVWDLSMCGNSEILAMYDFQAELELPSTSFHLPLVHATPDGRGILILTRCRPLDT